MKSDLIKSSETLRNGLLARWEELGIKDTTIAEDARKRGIKGITIFNISKWRHDPNSRGSLNQYQLIFLAFRFGIRIRLNIGEATFDGKKLKHYIPPYNEEKALKELYEVFPKLKQMKGYAKAKPRKKRVTKKK